MPEFIEQVKAEIIRREMDIQGLDALKSQKELRTEEKLAQGRQGNPIFIFICFVIALLGGLGGIIAGYVYSQSTHVAPSGRKYYVYDEGTRKNGKAMMWVGTGMLVIFFYRAMVRSAGI